MQNDGSGGGRKSANLKLAKSVDNEGEEEVFSERVDFAEAEMLS